MYAAHNPFEYVALAEGNGDALFGVAPVVELARRP